MGSASRILNVPEICTILKVVCSKTDFEYHEEYNDDYAMRGGEQIIVKPSNGRSWQFLNPNESRRGMSILEVLGKVDRMEMV